MSERDLIAEQVGETLADEIGMQGFCVWKKGFPQDSHLVEGPVWKFLANPINQSGIWCIDGGWGGPPGPIHVKWDEGLKRWVNGGFCGRGFKCQ